MVSIKKNHSKDKKEQKKLTCTRSVRRLCGCCRWVNQHRNFRQSQFKLRLLFIIVYHITYHMSLPAHELQLEPPPRQC